AQLLFGGIVFGGGVDSMGGWSLGITWVWVGIWVGILRRAGSQHGDAGGIAAYYPFERKVEAASVEEQDVDADRTVGKGAFTELRQLGLVCGESHFVQGQVDGGA